ncbi:MAG: transposase [Opitutales bacterium]|nr:transposase [Opitutales bacterium]
MNLIPQKRRRAPRILQTGRKAHYHVVSRINGRAFLLLEKEKELFRNLLARVADFCGVRLLTYALLDNHFHLLLEVPETAGNPDDEELRRRARLIYGKERPGQPLSFARIDLALRAGGTVREQMRQILIGRMGSLPMFMKILKQRFSIAYNKGHDRCGTLWEDRYHSVLVEDRPAVLMAVAAYIDLNPVRAAIVDDPKDYRFSGYGEAVGKKAGIRSHPLFQMIAERYAESVDEIAAAYRRLLFIKGSNPTKGGTVSQKAMAKALAQKGELSAAELLRCRLRFMTRGAILGTQAYIEAWIERNKTHIFPKRPRSPRKQTNTENTPLFSLRNG